MGNVGYITQPSLFGQPFVEGFGEPEFYVKRIERTVANDLIVKNHYSKKFFTGTTHHLGIFISSRLTGVLQFGRAMNPQSGGSLVEGATIDDFVELNRMWLDDSAPRNSESRAISFAIKYLRRVDSRIKFIQSFADERCGCFGVVYQAANFGYYGEHTACFFTLGDEVFHNSIMTDGRRAKTPKGALLRANKESARELRLRQFRYLYFIDKSWEKRCLLKKQPYPKHGTEV